MTDVEASPLVGRVRDEKQSLQEGSEEKTLTETFSAFWARHPRLALGIVALAAALAYCYALTVAPYKCKPVGSSITVQCANDTLHGGCGLLRVTVVSIVLCAMGLPLLAYGISWCVELERGKGNDGVIPAPGAAQGRIEIIDNGKFCCNMMIVTAHFGYYNIVHEYADTQSWLKDAEHTLIYVDGFGKLGLHIAALLSGYMCRKDEPHDKASFRAFKLLLLLLSWSMFVKPLVLRSLEKLGDADPWDVMFRILRLQAWEKEWYLQALLLWRFAAPLIRMMPPPLAVLMAFTISGLAGYRQLDDEIWTLNSVAGMFPCFVIGMFLPIEAVAKKVPRSVSAKILALIISMCWGRCVITPLAGVEPMFSYGFPDEHTPFVSWTYEYTLSYQKLSAGCPLDFELFWFRRMANQLLLLVPILLILLVVVPMEQVWFSRLGEHTLYSYLWHELLLRYRSIFISRLPLPILTQTWQHLLVLVINLPWVPLISTTLCSWQFRYLFSPLMDSGPNLLPFLLKKKSK